LNLIDEILHVGRKAAGHQDTDIELPGGSIVLCLIKPGLDILQALSAL
jgi:hypothetical protein